MYTFVINGENYFLEDDINILEYLREELHLTSLKNGCGEGACGACMILVDGKPVRACILRASQVHGKKLLTVEGFSEEEKEAYGWAFAEAGAVQCGFCIPGMMISAKGLLDQTLHPSPQAIKQAIKGNICRCTGYVKIEKGVHLAAQVLRGEIKPHSPKPISEGIGTKCVRVDAVDKALGKARYVDDLRVDGMLYGVALRTRYPRALVKALDVSAVVTAPGVVAVMTAEDIPGQRYWGHIFHDWPALVAVGEETRTIGDAVALVAAQTRKQARDALKLIRVEYEKREPLTSPAAALAEGAPLIHPKGNILSKTHVRRGNPEEALQHSAYVISHRYTTPPTEHAFMEPESALAVPQPEGGLLVYVGSQSVYDDQHGICAILDLPPEKVRVISQTVGGAFGGKEDLTVQHHAALLAWKTGRPVKVTLTRSESMLVHPKRHAMEIEVTTGCDAQGNLTAIQATVMADGGAYASLGSAVVERACTHLGGPYVVPNFEVTGLCVYTNNPPAGAFRGFGVPQSNFASESNLNLLAEKVGISPWEIRFRNALEPGLEGPTGQIADDGTAVKETLLAVREVYDSSPYAGIACALKNSGIGVGLPDISRVILKIEAGKVRIYTSAQCVGQGLATIMGQMINEATGITQDSIEVVAPDTWLTPDAGTTTASRQTLFTGEATRQAALALQQALEEKSLMQLEGTHYYGEYSGQTDSLQSTKPHPTNHVAYSFATHVAILNEKGMVQKVVAAHDVGRAINPIALEGQIEGGVVMGLGFSLREDFPLQNGVPAAKYGTLGLFRAPDVPEIETIILEKNPSSLAYGAKGIGEISSIPITAAVAGAYRKLDGKLRLRLPLEETPYSFEIF